MNDEGDVLSKRLLSRPLRCVVAREAPKGGCPCPSVVFGFCCVFSSIRDIRPPPASLCVWGVVCVFCAGVSPSPVGSSCARTSQSLQLSHSSCVRLSSRINRFQVLLRPLMGIRIVVLCDSLLGLPGNTSEQSWESNMPLCSE